VTDVDESGCVVTVAVFVGEEVNCCRVKLRDTKLDVLTKAAYAKPFAECVGNGGFATVVSATVDSAFGSWRDCAHTNY
jgi:hypothetical protein